MELLVSLTSETESKIKLKLQSACLEMTNDKRHIGQHSQSHTALHRLAGRFRAQNATHLRKAYETYLWFAI